MDNKLTSEEIPYEEIQDGKAKVKTGRSPGEAFLDFLQENWIAIAAIIIVMLILFVWDPFSNKQEKQKSEQVVTPPSTPISWDTTVVVCPPSNPNLDCVNCKTIDDIELEAQETLMRIQAKKVKIRKNYQELKENEEFLHPKPQVKVVRERKVIVVRNGGTVVKPKPCPPYNPHVGPAPTTDDGRPLKFILRSADGKLTKEFPRTKSGLRDMLAFAALHPTATLETKDLPREEDLPD